METTPKALAEILVAAMKAAGATVTYVNASDVGRDGFFYATMPDGMVTTIRVEIND
jgi:hypothetical protein